VSFLILLNALTFFRYVNDLKDCICHYMSEMTDSNPELPPALRGQQAVIFGNMEELYHFHRLTVCTSAD